MNIDEQFDEHMPILASFTGIPQSFLRNEKVPYSGTFHGGEKGIRTLEYIPALHDFQSCAFDQLSHLSTGLLKIALKYNTTYF